MLRCFTAALTCALARSATFECAVRKQGEAERDRMTTLDPRLTEIARTVAGQ